MAIVKVRVFGNHGCQRDVKHGEKIESPCGEAGCLDCKAREFVKQLQNSGANVENATLTHWPAEFGGDPLREVQDDLLTGIRRGNF